MRSRGVPPGKAKVGAEEVNIGTELGCSSVTGGIGGHGTPVTRSTLSMASLSCTATLYSSKVERGDT